MNDMKQLVRDEDGLENEIKNLSAFAKDIIMTFVLNNLQYLITMWHIQQFCIHVEFMQE
jgi:hypothetical protein